jgi:hypothetical protein
MMKQTKVSLEIYVAARYALGSALPPIADAAAVRFAATRSLLGEFWTADGH